MIITLAGYDATSEDECRRHELVDGVLVEMPPRYPRHQRALGELAHQLDEQLPDDLGVVHSFDVLLKDGASPVMRKPDVVVAPFKLLHDEVTRFDAADVVMVAEILSEESEDVDLRIKLREYAVAGSRTTGSSLSTIRSAWSRTPSRRAGTTSRWAALERSTSSARRRCR